MSSDQELNKTSAIHKEFQNLLEKDFKDRKLVANQVIKAKVIDILKAHVIVDVRGKSEGMIAISEFKSDELTKLKVNDTISVYLERLEGREGEIVLSYSKAKSFAAWQKCINAFEKEEELVGKLVSKIKGGYILELFEGAISAFLPQSHLSLKPIRGAEVEKLMRTPIKVRIVRLDRQRGNVSCSRKEVLLQSQTAELKESLKNIKEGDIIENAVVRSIPEGKWGAFLDIGNNVTALLHQSDISWNRISSVTDVLSVGQTIPKIVISKFDEKTNRLSASIKLLTESPFENLSKKFLVGETYPAQIEKITDFGAFCLITNPDNVSAQGLLHQSQMDWANKNIKPSKMFSVSQKLNLKLIAIDEDNKRISLSYRETLENPWEKIKDKINSKTEIKITNITEKALFGEIVGLGLTGICHWRELNWKESIDDLKKFKKGQTITVKILEVTKDEKIRLSRRACTEDPFNWFKNNKKKVGSIISTKVVEVLKTGVKVAVDPEQKIIVMIKKNQLAVEPADCRPEIYSAGNTMADALIEELNIESRKVVLSPRAAQKREQDSLIKKFGEGAAKSGATLRNIFESAIGKKGKKDK